MGLLTDFYNTVAKFFRPQEETGDEASKSVATNRLKLVLMQDRTNLTPKILEQMRGELVDLLSKYLEMDKELLELNFEQEGDQVALMLSIPVIRAKDEEEIEKALAEAAEKKAEEASTKEESEEETEASDDIEEEVEAEDEAEDEDEDEGADVIEAVEEIEINEETPKTIEDVKNSETEKTEYGDDSEIKAKKPAAAKVEKDLKEKTNV